MSASQPARKRQSSSSPVASPPSSDESYLYKGTRTRWKGNDALAEKLKDLGDYLIIGGYPESHATRYAKLAYVISRYPESLITLRKENRMTEIAGIGGSVQQIIEELMDTGDCEKRKGFERESKTPRTVLELTRIPRLGAKMARALYHDHEIDSLSSLDKALKQGALDGVAGFGKKTLDTMREYIAGEKR